MSKWSMLPIRPIHLPSSGVSSELMTDPKARKVLVLENPMLPMPIKTIIASTLFDLLSVPSLSFAFSPLCALLSIGRITGLVLDVGSLESCLIPVRLHECYVYCFVYSSILFRYIPLVHYSHTFEHRQSLRNTFPAIFILFYDDMPYLRPI